MHGHSNEFVPCVSGGSHVAELAVDGVGLNKWVSGDDTWVPGCLAMRADEGSLIYFVVAALTYSRWERVTESTIHVDLEHPVTNLVSLTLR